LPRSSVKRLQQKSSRSLLSSYQTGIEQARHKQVVETVRAQGLRLKRADALMSRIVETNFDAILTVGPDGRIEMANAAASQIFGHPTDYFRHAAIAQLLPHFDTFITGLRLKDCNNGALGTVAVNAAGEQFPVHVSITQLEFGDERLTVAAVRDISEIREQQCKLEYQAMHDALTGLPNRLLLSDRLEHALKTATRSDGRLALLLLDLDRFKQVNDTLGHHVGDLLLQQLSTRLTGALRSSDTIARLGGDEFAILMEDVGSADHAMELCHRILAVFDQPFEVMEGIRLEVGGSIGIAMFPEHGDDSSRLMQCADVAMYEAKDGPIKIVFYNPSKDTNSVRQLTLSGELRQAILGGKLSVHLQPKLHLPTRRVKSVEALTRWHHERLGVVTPDEFIPHAEQTGLIKDLTDWMIREVLRQLAKWQEEGLEMTVAVNVSAKMLHDDTLPDVIIGLCREFGVPPHRLSFEITETAILSDPDAAHRNVLRLSELGSRISIDDFGTGYSSLQLLQRLPLDELKVDKTFVSGMLVNRADGIIVQSTIEMAHHLGLEVVAEGVEEEAQLEALAAMGCDTVQGFYLAQALPIDVFETWLKSTHDFGSPASPEMRRGTGSD